MIAPPHANYCRAWGRCTIVGVPDVESYISQETKSFCSSVRSVASSVSWITSNISLWFGELKISICRKQSINEYSIASCLDRSKRHSSTVVETWIFNCSRNTHHQELFSVGDTCIQAPKWGGGSIRKILIWSATSHQARQSEYSMVNQQAMKCCVKVNMESKVIAWKAIESWAMQEYIYWKEKHPPNNVDLNTSFTPDNHLSVLMLNVCCHGIIPLWNPRITVEVNWPTYNIES